VEHRHLLPDEIDLLVDGEEGFGVAPLMAHVEQCASCRASVEAQRRVVVSLERLPHHAPSPLFASRVMSRVRVFEPWYVAVLDSVQRFVPRSQPARVFAAAVAGVVAILVTGVTVWLGSRVDAVTFFANVAVERVRTEAMSMAGAFVSSTLGDAAAAALRGSGGIGVAALLTGLALTVLVAALGLRAVTASSRRRRM
jgi:hypothetical protein